MQSASIPSSNWSNSPDQNPSQPNALEAQMSTYSFPPKIAKDAQIAEHDHKKDQSLLIGQQQTEIAKIGSDQPNFKSYRSMSTPGFFPLKRRQSNSPLRMISFTEESSSEGGVVSDDYSSNIGSHNAISHPPLWSPFIGRSSIIDPDHKNSIQHVRRTSTPGTFTLKHMRQPSPLGMGSIGETSPSTSISSFSTSSFFSDITEHSSPHLETESNRIPSRPTSHVHRAASLDGTYSKNSNSKEFNSINSWNQNYSHHNNQSYHHGSSFPKFSRSSGSFSLKHQSRPSPLGSQLSLSVSPSPVVKQQPLVPLQTIVDESSSSTTQK